MSHSNHNILCPYDGQLCELNKLCNDCEIKITYSERKIKMEKDLIHGGLADGKPDSDFDSEQIAIGIEVEMEHTDNPEIAKEIAKDHLMEIPDYYTRLLKMEKDAEKEWKNI